MTRGVRTAAVTAILLLTVASCRNGEARGKHPLPPLSSAPTAIATTPTPTSSATATRKDDHRAAVEGFARAYFAKVDEAAAAGDTSDLRSLMLQGCKCRETADFIDRSFKAGSVRGLRHRISRVDVQHVGADTADVVVTVSITSYDVLNSRGEVTHHEPAVKRAIFSHTLRRVSSEWRVAVEAIVVYER